MESPIFLNAENDSKDHILKYFNVLNNYIMENIDPWFPYVQGEFPHKLQEFLREKELLFGERSPEDVLVEMSEYFRGTTRWHHPYVMNNIKTPVNLPALAVAFNAMLLDPNLAGDTNCGQIAFAELEVVKYMAKLVGWDDKNSNGYFTFGGTSTLLNAIKVGINEIKQDACLNGLAGDDIFIVSSEQGHSAHADVCNWLGLGSKNCVRIPTDVNYQMDLDAAKKMIYDRIERGGKLAAIIGCGGTTIQMLVDPIKQLYQLREETICKYSLNYRPHIHVDSVVGWVWLFYKGYEYDKNPLRLSDDALTKIQRMESLIAQCKFADSIGIDFHKTGFCPYASSLFLVKRRKQIFELNHKAEQTIEQLEYGDYSPSTYTLELSRSSTGPLTALTTLKLLGVQGFRKLLGEIVEGSTCLIRELDKIRGFEVVNKDTNGTCVLYVIKPIGLEDVSYFEFYSLQKEKVENLALYNYHFYCFVLKNLHENKIPFFIDYSSGYEKVQNGFHMGVLKMQSFNPMLTKDKVYKLVQRIRQLKDEYDHYRGDYYFDVMYKPKKPKLTYNDKKIL
ncbi:MAG: hypothetical protein HFH85_21175 [Lachnospiraceae bacterium]|nr:hypothetical protein [Lachnospiraceae bacterium]